MAEFKIFVLFYTTSIIYFSSYALVGEGLVSKNLAVADQFTYQVVIIGRKNYSTDREVICGGGIIGEKLILTAAQCFVSGTGHHREFTFSIIAGQINLNNKGGVERLVDIIYLIQDGPFYFNDISVAQLAEVLGIVSNPHLSQLDIPSYDYVGNGYYRAVIAGHGVNEIEVDYLDDIYYTNDAKRVRIETDWRLRFAYVIILQAKYCLYKHFSPNTMDILCGAIHSSPEVPSGLCDFDAGSPLVINDSVVGVASSNHYNCFDGEYGGIYTSVYMFNDFIKPIMRGYYRYGTIIYKNRRHVLRRPALFSN